MTGKQKIEAAFSKEGTREIPCVIPYDRIYVRDHLDKYVTNPWWYVHEIDIERQTLYQGEIIEKLGIDWFQVVPGYSLEERKNLAIEVRNDGIFRQNKLNGKEERLSAPISGGGEESVNAHNIPFEKLAQTKEDIDRVIFATAGNILRPFEKGMDDVASRLIKGAGNNKSPFFHSTSPLRWTYEIWGYEGMMVLIATEPDIVKYACEKFLEVSVNSVHNAAAIGAEVIWIEDCFTDAISPESYKELAVPYAAQLVDEIHSLGLKSVYYFTGNPTKKIEHVLSIGADAFAFEESKKNFTVEIEDLVDMVKGRCTLLGNLDAIGILQNGTEEQLRSEIKRQIIAGRKNKNKFIMSLGSPATPETPVKKLQLYCDMARELGLLQFT